MSFIKLDRKMLDWEWFSDPATAHLWVYLLLRANYQRKSWQGIVVDEGCLITSESRLSSETGLSRQQIRTALKKLISTKEITKVSTKEYTLIKVEKWGLYQVNNQDDNQESTSQSTSRATHRATTTKQIKNTRNKEIHSSSTHPTIDDVRSYCLDRHNNVDAERFWNYYESNGWKVGRNPMKDWKACVRTWERKNVNTNVRTDDTVPIYSTANNSVMSKNEEKELLALMGKA